MKGWQPAVGEPEKKIVIIAGPNGAAAIRAGRMMLEEIDRCAAEGESFAFETTLAGHTYLRRIEAWRRSGYVVKLVFLSLGSPEEVEWIIGSGSITVDPLCSYWRKAAIDEQRT